MNVAHRIVPQVHHECLGSLPLQLLQCLGHLAGSGLSKGGEVQETNCGLPLAAAGKANEAQMRTALAGLHLASKQKAGTQAWPP